ncbi:MAG: hypothetical protein AAB796_01160 [Patescibacteria group bacterium]
MENINQTILSKDSEWSVIDGEPCRASGFEPTASVQNKKVIALNLTNPYASVILECKKSPGKIKGLITHKIDFIHLWAAFKERGISENEEVLIIWTTKHYKYKLLKFFALAYPKIWVMICPKGALEIMVDQNWKPELTGDARWNAMRPIMEWKPQIMK